VTQAWAGSFEGLLHNDIDGANERLATECRLGGDEFLIPFGTVNPQLPDWKEDLRRCHEKYRMPGIRIFPNYHGYELDSPDTSQLLTLASDQKLIVQIPVRIEDPRTQHRLLAVPDVNLQPLISIVEKLPQLYVVILNGLMSLSPDMQARLARAGNVYYELATLEGIGGVTRLLKSVPVERILFGSHFPFFVWDSADLKLRESALPGPHVEQIRAINASTLRSHLRR
jgi:predicted TIM-barrel fold metal-dependent hydrolase